jgi:hypothetical protein
VSQQDYDFFATAHPDDEPVRQAVPPAPVRRPGQFGGAVDGEGRPVNQFGTPLDAVATPAGPSVAPGYGAGPSARPGAGATWPSPAGTPSGGYPAPAYPAAAPGSNVHRGVVPVPYQQHPRTPRPGAVLAVGIYGIVQGALLLAGGLLALLALGVVGSRASSSATGGEVLVIMGITFGLLLAVGALYLAAGIGAVRSRRWAVWTLLVLEGLTVLFGGWGLVTGRVTSVTSSAGQVAGLGLAAVAVALLVIPTSWAWLTDKH